MREAGIRELKQNASAVVVRPEGGGPTRLVEPDHFRREAYGAGGLAGGTRPGQKNGRQLGHQLG